MEGLPGSTSFFVISGYLIGAHVYREVSEDRFSLARFYQRRAKRILPALFLVLLFSYAAGALLLSPVDLKLLADYAMTAVLSVSNVFASRSFDYFAKSAIAHPLLMTWSLGVEENFYVFFPPAVLMLGWLARRKKWTKEKARRWMFGAVLLAGVLSFALCVRTTSHVRMQAFFLLPSRAWELAAGVLMAIYEAGQAETDGTGEGRGRMYGGERWETWRGVAGLAAVVFAVLRFGPATLFPGVAAALPVAGAVLLLSSPGCWVNRRLLSLPPMRWIGLVSYSWYLWHWPLLSFATIAAAGPLPVRAAVVIAVIALGCAWASYRLVEQPFRASRMAPLPLLRRYGAVCLLFLAVPAVMHWTSGLPRRYPSVAEQDAVLVVNPHACFGSTVPDGSQDCLPKDDGRPAVALFGDSHASALGPEMLTMANAAGMRMLTLARPSCAPLQGVVRRSLDFYADRACVEFNRVALKRLEDDSSVRLVVLYALWAGPALDPPGFGYVPANFRGDVNPSQSAANLSQGLRATIAGLTGAGKRVIVVKDAVPLKFNPVDRVETYLMPARRWLARILVGPSPVPGVTTQDEMYGAENAAAGVVIEQIASEQKVETFDAGKELCTERSCTYFANGLLMYRDSNHMSRAGAHVALQKFPLAGAVDR